MDHERNVIDNEAKQSPITVVTADGDHDFPSVSKAARALAQARHGKKPDAGDPPAPANHADPRIEPAPAADAAEPDHLPSETRSEGEEDPSSEARRAKEEGADPAEPPSIEPPRPDAPRSWTKEDKELFRSLPRETQERVAERERSRESDFLRRQNEAAEKLKGLTAREQTADQARQHYENALTGALQLIQARHADEFGDIKSQADIDRMAKDDMPRYVKWSEQQRQIAVAVEQVKAAQERAAREAQQKWSEFVTREDALLIEHVPELAEPAAMVKMQGRAVDVLKEHGFTQQELAQWWAGGLRPPLRDHRMQRLVYDVIKYRDAQRKAKEAVAKPVPPVQRPGVSQPRGAAQDAQIQALTKRLEASGSLKDAAALIAARRKAGR